MPWSAAATGLATACPVCLRWVALAVFRKGSSLGYAYGCPFSISRSGEDPFDGIFADALARSEVAAASAPGQLPDAALSPERPTTWAEVVQAQAQAQAHAQVAIAVPRSHSDAGDSADGDDCRPSILSTSTLSKSTFDADFNTPPLQRTHASC